MTRTFILDPSYVHLKAEIANFIEHFNCDDCGIVIQNTRNLTRRVTCTNGTSLYIKRYHRPKGVNLFVYSLGVRPPKCRRACTHAARLLAAGFESPFPAGYAEERQFGLLGYSYFISAACPYAHRLYEWGDAPEGSYEEFAEALGRFTARLHEKGFLHKDYSPGNVLWEKSADGYHFALVDTNQMRFGPVGLRRGCGNFARLWGTKRFFAYIVGSYARQRGFDEQKCIATALEARRRFWRMYARRKPEKVGFKLEL